jgi:hypothetical protein
MQKVDSYVFIEEQLEASAAMWKERADKCKGIADRFSKARERLRGRIKFVMDDLGTTELQGDYHRYSLVPLKPKLVITDASQLPADCMMVVTKTVPDNDKIKFMLLAGAEVPGAELEPVHALRTYGSTKGVE